MSRDEVVELFWPESSAESAATNFRSTLHALRRAIEPDGRVGVGVVFSDRASVWLRTDAEFWVDADEFERIAGEAERSCEPLPALQRADALYLGDFLPDDVDHGWSIARRDALKHTWSELQFHLARAAEGAGDVESAARALERLLLNDPCDERSGQDLMRLYARHGRPAEAVRVYQQLVQSLHGDLGVSPSSTTIALYTSLSAVDRDESSDYAMSLFRCAYPFPVRGDLIGRDAELAVLERVLGRGRSAGQAVLVGAPAGTGKSALIGQIVRRAQTQGVLCLAGGCYEERSAVPFGPFRDALVDYLLAQPVDRLHADLGNSIRDLARVIPELRYHARLAEDTSTDTPQMDQLRVFGAIHACLRRLAERGPTLLCVEDLHAADDATLQLFHYLLRQTRRLPLVLIGTFRSDEVASDQLVAQTLATITREGLAEQMSLKPLGRDETNRLAASLLEGAPSQTFAESLYDSTGGNPLFVEQLLLALSEGGLLFRRGGVWHRITDVPVAPKIVREVIGERFSHLSTSCRYMLSMCSVLGQKFEHTVLLSALEPVDETSLLADLDAALRASLLQEIPAGYAFSHALVRDAVYLQLSTPRRMLMHARAGELLEELWGVRADDHAPDLARHFTLASDSVDSRSKALHYSMVAGRRADALAAYKEALTHFSLACELIEQDARLAPFDSYLDALEGRGRAERETAMWPSALATFRRILELTTETRRRARVRAVLVSAMLYHDPAEALNEIELGLTELVGAVKEDTDTALAYLHLQSLKALVWFLRGHYRDLRSLGEQMLELASTLDRPLGIAWAHSVLAWSHQGQGHIAQGLAEYLLSLEAARAAHNNVQEAVVRVNLGHLNYLGGEFATAREQLNTAIALYRESAGELPTLNALFRVALILLARGEVAEAREQATSALAMAIQAQIRFAADYHDVLGRVEALCNQWADAEASFQQSISIRKQVGYMAGTADSLIRLGATYQQRGRVEEAQAAYDEALRIVESIDPGLELVAAHRQLASLHLRAGETSEARVHVDRALSVIESEGLQHTLEYSPTLLVFSALLAHVGSRAPALEFAERAVAAAKTVEHQLEACASVASLEAFAGRVDASKQHADQALQLADRLAVPRLLGVAHRARADAAAAMNDVEGYAASLKLALIYFEAAQTPHAGSDVLAAMVTDRERSLTPDHGQAGPA